jgi:hypothetical protein
MQNSAEVSILHAPTPSARRRGFSRHIQAALCAGLLAASVGACSNSSSATGGVGGASGADSGVGGAADLPTITSDMYGAFDNAFMITPCGTPVTQGYDCPNRPPGGGACPTAMWPGNTGINEPTGNTYTETFTVTATDPNKVYAITVRVRGQAEGRTYLGGARHATTPTDPSAASGDLLYIGGQPGATRVDYNVFELRIVPPDGAAIADEPLYYAFNAVDAQHEGQHMNYQLDETFTMRVKSGFTLNLTSHDSNCIAIQNCGPQGTPYSYTTAADCQAHAATGPQPAVPGVTLPTEFRGMALANGGAQPFQTQFLNFKVTEIVAQ